MLAHLKRIGAYKKLQIADTIIYHGDAPAGGRPKDPQQSVISIVYSTDSIYIHPFWKEEPSIRKPQYNEGRKS